ncbi:MAG: tetratricopeptide repeat protein [Sphingomicrobium sp.]
MLVVLVAFAAATSPVPLAGVSAAAPLGEARHALSVGRLDQARTMIANAVAAGATGEPVDRLLADLAFAKADNAQALSLYRALLPGYPNDAAMLGQAGIAALRLGDNRQATALLHRAVALRTADWRAWNALGAAADARGDWAAADIAYDRALILAPHRAEVANNRGWSLVLRGRWHEAEAELARGVALDPSLPRLANNLQLARDSLATALPERRVGESDAGWAARLNDSGVAAAGQGDRARAIAAFARSIAARPTWDARTAANLASVEAYR